MPNKKTLTLFTLFAAVLTIAWAITVHNGMPTENPAGKQPETKDCILLP